MYFEPLQMEIDLDETNPLFLMSLFNPPSISELFIGLREVFTVIEHYIMQLLILYGEGQQLRYGTLTVWFHEKRMAYCSEMPGFPSEEWKTFASEHFAKAILCSDKVNTALDVIEAVRMAIPALTWTAIAGIQKYLDPDTEFVLNDHLDELFQF